MAKGILRDMNIGDVYFHVLESVYGNIYGYVEIELIEHGRVTYTRNTFKEDKSLSVEQHRVDEHMFKTFISSPSVFPIKITE